MTTSVLPKKSLFSQDKAQRPARVILYNDDWHTFEEVIIQLVKATGCSPRRAEAHAHTVHTQGRDLVFHGSFAECEKVVGVLRQIRLQAEIDYDD